MEESNKLLIFVNKIHLLLNLKELTLEQKDMLTNFLLMYDEALAAFNVENTIVSSTRLQLLSTPILAVLNNPTLDNDNEAIKMINDHLNKKEAANEKGYARVRGNSNYSLSLEERNALEKINGFTQVILILSSTVIIGILLGILLFYIK